MLNRQGLYGDFFSFYLCDLLLQGERQRRPTGLRQGGRPALGEVHAAMKYFSERNPLVVGAIGVAVIAGVVLGALNYGKLPFFRSGKEYSAYFADAGGLLPGAAVQVSGFKVGTGGQHRTGRPAGAGHVRRRQDIRLGDRTEASIKTKSLLGAKILEVTPRGDGRLSGPIPLERTHSPYQLPDALGDLGAAISGLDTNQLSESLAVLADTFSDTPPDLKIAVRGCRAVLPDTDDRDAQLRNLLANANKATTVLSERSDQIVSLVADTNALLVAIAEPEPRAGPDLRQHLGGEPADQGLHRRQPADPQAGAGQAQRGSGDRRQPQRPSAAVDQEAQRLRDVAGRVGVLGSLLQRSTSPI